MFVRKNGLIFNIFRLMSMFLFTQIYSNARSLNTKKFLQTFVVTAPYHIKSIQVNSGFELRVLANIRTHWSAHTTYSDANIQLCTENENKIMCQKFYNCPILCANSIGKTHAALKKVFQEFNEPQSHANSKVATPMKHFHQHNFEDNRLIST